MDLFCPDCGKKTLHETEDYGLEAGTLHRCFSCGSSWYMSLSEPAEITAPPDPKRPYRPIYDDIEVMLDRAWKISCRIFKTSGLP
jgi:hypothetical protein